MSVRLLGTTRAVQPWIVRRFLTREEPVDRPAPETQVVPLTSPRSAAAAKIAEPATFRPAEQIGPAEAHSPVLEASR